MRSFRLIRVLVPGLLGLMLLGHACPGLNLRAALELKAAGVDRYLGEFTPFSSRPIEDGWVEHSFDPEAGDGPICIAGTPYSVYTRAGHPAKLLIMEQGGGACWQDFYNCNIRSEDQAPPGAPVGIWDFDSPDNPFADYSIVYLPYCDGSVFVGDNAVEDPSFPFGPVRHHRGLRNASAGIDVARAVFPHARQITVAGSSAGGVGASAFSPFLVRFAFGNAARLTVFNDAGPITTNLDRTDDIAARADDWQFDRFYPESCTECSAYGQSTEVVKWRLANDSTIREAFYETDADQTNRFFLGLLGDPAGFRELIVSEHGEIHDAFPDRYKRFIVAGDVSHTALQTPLFYTQDANGIILSDWTSDFLRAKPGWVDVVEDPVLP
ncbi:MAG: pectin acetylesterase-family hydrolase [Myxococcota bacterium]